MKDTEKKSWVYYVAIFLVKIWYAIMFKVEIIGKENIPETGNGVICSNHYSNYDPVSTAIYLDRLPHYIAKKELFKNKLFSWVLDQLGVFPIDRKVSMDMKAVKTAIKLLKEGKIVGIFAEGRRVKAGEDVAAKAGVALFAMKGNAPVIPCAISGTYKFRSKLTIRYGEPLTLDEFRDKKLTTENFPTPCERITTVPSSIPSRLSMICSPLKFDDMLAILRQKGLKMEISQTICSATEKRQKEAMELSQNVDKMIVIGDKKSSNTQKLVEICKKNCENTVHIETICDLVLKTFKKDDRIGITAGASTPPAIIKEVVVTMSEIENVNVDNLIIDSRCNKGEEGYSVAGQ